jgi:hypothetical protein
LIKRFSFDVFHGDELRAFQLSQFIDMDDIRMIERRCGLGFLVKATLQGRPLFPAATTSAQGIDLGADRGLYTRHPYGLRRVSRPLGNAQWSCQSSWVDLTG